MGENERSNGSHDAAGYRFAQFLVNVRNRQLFRDEVEVLLTPKAFDILLVFLKNPDRLLEKDELITEVWDSKFVEEGNLARNVSTLRKALGGDAHDHRYILTRPGRGYRFVAEVSRDDSQFASEKVTHDNSLNGSRGRTYSGTPKWWLTAITIAVVALSTAGIWYFARRDSGHLTSVSTMPADDKARQFFLTGKYLFQQSSDKSGTSMARPLLIQSLENYQQTINIEPGFAPAYAEYAKACQRLATTGYQTTYYYIQARAALKKAIELDDTLAVAHGALGYNSYVYKHDLKGAEREYERAIELDPNSESRHSHAMNLAMCGKIDEAITEIEIALHSDASQPIVRQNAGRIYLEAGEVDKAIEQFESVVKLSPENPIGRARLGVAQVISGNYDDGISNIRSLVESPESDSEDRAILGWALGVAGHRDEAKTIADGFLKTDGHIPAMIFSGLGETTNAVIELEYECPKFSRRLTELRIEPYYFDLRNEPRYKALLAELDNEPEPDE